MWCGEGGARLGPKRVSSAVEKHRLEQEAIYAKDPSRRKERRRLSVQLYDSHFTAQRTLLDLAERSNFWHGASGSTSAERAEAASLIQELFLGRA